RPASRRGVGTACGSRHRQGWRAARRRRHRRHDLADRLLGSEARRRRAATDDRRKGGRRIPGSLAPRTPRDDRTSGQLIDRFASTASFFQVSYWRCTSAFISSGVVARGSPPLPSRLCLTYGTPSALTTCALRRSTVGFVSFGGPASPVQEITSNPGMAASSTVGTSGK